MSNEQIMAKSWLKMPNTNKNGKIIANITKSLINDHFLLNHR